MISSIKIHLNTNIIRNIDMLYFNITIIFGIDNNIIVIYKT